MYRKNRYLTYSQLSQKEECPMTLDWLTYTRHVLTWLLSTLFLYTVFSAHYVNVQIAILVACFFIPFLFEQAKMKQKTKWTLNLLITLATVIGILFTQKFRITFTYSQITHLLIFGILLIFIDAVISHSNLMRRVAK